MLALGRRPRRADPAPSRMAYRLQRWMLTPGIRTGLRIGVPLGLLTIATALYLADPARREALTGWVADIRTSIEQRPEFRVERMEIEGADAELSRDIHQVVAVEFPLSSFDLDLETVRDRIMALDPVKQAVLRIRPGGVLEVSVTERRAVVLWRTVDGLALLDGDGVFIRSVSERAAHPDMPLIAGRGAEKEISEALALTAASRPLDGRLRGFVRIGERRWDVILDRDQRIMLPAEQPVRALERVIALDQAEDMLARDVLVADMRLSERPTLRMNARAHDRWLNAREGQ